MATEVAQHKKDTVNMFTALIEEYPIIGAIDMEGLPARQLQIMRETLRETVVIKMTKRRLMSVALEQAKKDGIKDLEKHLTGMPAILFTKENPFTLYKTIKKNKSPAPAKAGSIAPKDIKIPAGPTPFAPGPIIGELGKFGLKTGVENGKVAIKEEKVVVKEGEEINASLAGLLTRLGIQPMEVGLNITAVYENGDILTKKVLDIDEEAYIQDVQTAAAGAMNLALNASIANKETINTLLSMAGSQGNNLGLEAGIINKENAEHFLTQAQATMLSLASHLPEEIIPEELQRATPAPAETPAAPEKPPEEETPTKETKEDDDGDSEEDTAAGMGALFG